jgi:hypothetical protein
MFGWRFVLGSALVGLVACGGQADEGQGGDPGSSGASGASGGAGVIGATGGRTSNSGGASVGGTGQAGQSSGGSTFVDPGCPDIEPPPPIKECDPLGSDLQCPFGTGCYPYVDHPFGSGCGTQTYGARCALAGSGTQGAACGDGNDYCAPSFVCVVGAHPGRHCAKLCTFDGLSDCPPGLFCDDVDIEGYGVCG